MLSICIPVYNAIITTLVEELHKQCTACKISFEIICIDDASSSHNEENKNILKYQEVNYAELSENIGRSAIRNKLAEQAKYEYLLFLDCDVVLLTTDFIGNYVTLIHSKAAVAVGGRTYIQNQFTKETELHFRYGNSREVISADKRALNPYASFVTGNFIIQKNIFSSIKFLASLKEYGHEDTLFGIELKKHSISIIHIDNPVAHIGLEKNEIFIQKQLTAIKNLSTLILNGYDMRSISIYDFYLRLKKYHLINIFVWGFAPIQPLVKRSLESGRTSWLALFDLLRLYELAVYLKKLK
jgi:glycosyltransferase involved in cell wall biosynthesis